MSRSSNSSKLFYQSLEERKLLAGDVSVIETDQLFIRGDELSNQIEIVADDSGQVFITGLNNTTINGGMEPFQVSNNVDLNGARGRNARLESGLNIQTLGGNDRIDIRGLEIDRATEIDTGEGDDFVRLIRSTSRHDLMVNTDVGHDTTIFVQTRVRGDFDVTTNLGNDALRLHNSRTWGSTNLETGAGDDSLSVSRARFTGDSQIISAQAGNDQILIRNNQVNEQGLFVRAGHGHDDVFARLANTNDLDGEIRIAGQAGFDVLDADVDEAMSEMMMDSGIELSGNLVYDDGLGGIEGITSVGASYFEPNATDFQAASNIIPLQTTEAISRISWTGGYLRDINEEFSVPYETDDFTIKFYEGDIGAPIGDPIATFDVGNNVNRQETGVFNGIYETEIFSYSAEVDVTLEAGQIYWVSIYAGVEDEVPTGSDAGLRSVWGWAGGLGQNDDDINGTAYTFTTSDRNDFGWFNDRGIIPSGSAGFQLWS